MKHLLFNLFLVIILVSFNKCKPKLFSSKIVKLQTIELVNKQYKINVYHIPSDATIQSSIQIRKEVNDREDIIANYERYNCLDTCKLINDSIIILVIRDTISFLGKNSKPDTVKAIIR